MGPQRPSPSRCVASFGFRSRRRPRAKRCRLPASAFLLGLFGAAWLTGYLVRDEITYERKMRERCGNSDRAMLNRAADEGGL